MRVKLLELRDKGTFIPLLCIDMNPDLPGGEEKWSAQLYLLRRCGYPCDCRPNIAITHLATNGDPCWNDPYAWGGRTRRIGHDYIIKHWRELSDGDVIDVEYILGETNEKKVSERGLVV